MRNIAFLLIIILFLFAGSFPSFSQEENTLLLKLNLLASNRNGEDFLYLLITLFGPPQKVFNYQGLEVWFYQELDTALLSEPMKEVYLFFQGRKLIKIEKSTSSLNPYNQFAVYP
ncbi:MAG: hypothetical protein DRP68_03430 [Candidatus Omnitrophota bacterium]|nr:MAG: hypothetical protein DRP68_03430 [Candidatus Omnitrophota bacterium]RKY46366.1 MAG: hypothetical protein DRP81_00635 [Candidatus Omnitrophota bacterium]HDN86644.1 hypothetical protein [Candidatus Omnitrophota bacterium]